MVSKAQSIQGSTFPKLVAELAIKLQGLLPGAQRFAKVAALELCDTLLEQSIGFGFGVGLGGGGRAEVLGQGQGSESALQQGGEGEGS